MSAVQMTAAHVNGLVGAVINLNGHNGEGHYIHWGFIQLSVANLVVILAMVVMFVLAILLPFPGHKDAK